MVILLPGESEPTERKILLDTALGSHIENAQILEISAFEENQYAGLKKWDDSVTMRTTATPRYNCHGMTFATRRTGIYSTEAINMILKEDGYEEIQLGDIKPGDVILYFADDGDIEHSGIVISTPTENDFGVPNIISKWGKYKEFIHRANTCPYSFSSAKYYRIVIKNEPTLTT